MFGGTWFAQGFFGGAPVIASGGQHVTPGDSAYTTVTYTDTPFATVSGSNAAAASVTGTDTLP